MRIINRTGVGPGGSLANLILHGLHLAPAASQGPITTDATFTVQSGPDDGSWNTFLSFFSNTQTKILFGSDGDGHYSSWLRFTNVTIPQNATINSATLNFKTTATQASLGISPTIYGVAADNPGNPATFTEAEALAHTTGVVWTNAHWTASVPASATPTIVTPDISTSVQEIVNRAGWRAGRALMLVLVGRDADALTQQTLASYEQGVPYTAPQLVVNYTYTPALTHGHKKSKMHLGIKLGI